MVARYSSPSRGAHPVRGAQADPGLAVVEEVAGGVGRADTLWPGRGHGRSLYLWYPFVCWWSMRQRARPSEQPTAPPRPSEEREEREEVALAACQRPRPD